MPVPKLTIRVKYHDVNENSGYYLHVDEEPTLPSELGCGHEYDNPNTALGHFIFQLSTVQRLEDGVKLDIFLE